MSEFPRLEHAPIVEAQVDFRADLPPHTSAASLEKIGAVLGAEYPHVRNVTAVDAIFGMGPDTGLPQAMQRYHDRGRRFESEDERHVVQAEVDGFVFSRLAPYEHWDSLRDRARRTWRAYCDVARPIRVRRIALRYVNRIELPQGEARLDEYFQTRPMLGPQIPWAVGELFLRFALPMPGEDATAVVTQATTEATPGAGPAVLLDIGVIQTVDLGPAVDELWDALERLRVLKNRLFFGSITDALVERLR